MHKRLIIVTRNALGDRISPRGACCQRMNASWSTSSASPTVPSILYAIEKRRLGYSLNAANGSGACSELPSSAMSFRGIALNFHLFDGQLIVDRNDDDRERRPGVVAELRQRRAEGVAADHRILVVRRE